MTTEDQPIDATITFHPIDTAGEISLHEVQERLADAPEGIAVLVQRRGPEPGLQYVLAGQSTTIGRVSSADILLDDITVSREHARILRTDHGYDLEDANSLNGTYLNREIVSRASLTTGDEVQIGKFRLVFLLGGEAI
jgi:predicted component of type VI protein secretion system